MRSGGPGAKEARGSELKIWGSFGGSCARAWLPILPCSMAKTGVPRSQAPARVRLAWMTRPAPLMAGRKACSWMGVSTLDPIKI